MSRWRELLACVAVATGLFAGAAAAEKLGIGRPALPEEIDAWDVAVLPDGTGLRPGSGDVATGEAVFAEKCASCHGEFAEGIDSWPVLAGGEGTLTDARPVKTVGSYWPHLSTAWDYVHRSMPFGSAQTVSVDETYAIVAFLLYSNGLVEDDFVLSDANFGAIRLPNAEGFYEDDRPAAEYPKFSGAPCMTDCTAPVTITKRASELKVTPTDADGRPAGTLPDVRPVAADAEALAAEPEVAPMVADAPSEPEVMAVATDATAPDPAASALDPAMVEAGAAVFKKCAACHKVGEGARNAVGPHLNAVFGRTAGTVEGFKYSKPMADAGAGGLVWDEAALDGYLADPKGFLPKNKMAFAGLKKPEDRTALIAYLRSLGE
jgi:cytochrome c